MFLSRIEEGASDLTYEDLIKCENDLGLCSFDIPHDFQLSVIDGQHRLTALFLSDDPELDEIELPIVILFGVSYSVAAKLFSEINSHQKKVDKQINL
ncbi:MULTISPECIES: DNA sulfur modification protein DndB [Aneurinibacillus]|uniref:DNA sulfur modification protein DndB n=1 Tax=Aneurinibacillus TaxID=55079 RepID=UPI00352850BD